MKKNGFAPLIIILIIAVIGVVGYLGYKNLSTPTPTTYIGVGNSEGKYALINTRNYESKDLTPSGYKLLGYNYAYKQFPDYLLLRKDNVPYSYNLANYEIKQITGLTVKSSERINIISSISEKNKFYIHVIDTRPNPDNEMTGEDIIGEKGYFYDAITNQISSYDKIINGFPSPSGLTYGCLVYDSKYSRFFINPNQEPIFSALPLLSYDIKTGSQKEIIPLRDFGIDEKEKFGGRVFYNLGYFIAMSNTNTSKITLVEPAEIPTKTDLTLSDEDFKKLDIYGTYSGLYIKEKNIIFLGYADKVALLRFDKSNKLVRTKFLNHMEQIYINFPYTDGKNVYYRGENNNIVVVDLNTLEFKKNIPSTYSNTITLFR